MRCLYREIKYKCGDYLEIDLFPVFEYQRGRKKKRKPTSEIQKRLNQKNAERKLIRLLNTNFTEKDIRFDLTYREEKNPSSPEEAQKELQNFLRRVKRYRKKNNLTDLRYVAVTEIGEKKGRVHHHIIMSGDINISKLAKIWGRGYTTAKPLQFDNFGIAGIAKYLIKNPVLKKRWSASRNLKKPKTSKRDGRLPQFKVEEFGRSGDDNKNEIEKLYKGYLLAGCETYYNDFNGRYYLTIRMYEDPKEKRKRLWRKKKKQKERQIKKC